MVHTFSGCVLGSAEECDLDELLATRLVSFLMDHQESILSVPEYLRSAISDHIQYLRAVQVHAETLTLYVSCSILCRACTLPKPQCKELKKESKSIFI